MTMTATPMRSFLAVPFAGIMTFALFWAMASLIAMKTGPVEIKPKSPAIEFVRLQKEDSPVIKKPAPLKKVEDIPPPPIVDFDTSKTKPTNDGVAFDAPVLNEEVAITGNGGVATTDGDVMPLVRVAPQYPRKALSRGIEGWVQVSFTISKLGTVVNPRVIDADPTRVFDRAALKAVSQWKYKPKVENGIAVERHDVSTVITFELDK